MIRKNILIMVSCMLYFQRKIDVVFPNNTTMWTSIRKSLSSFQEIQKCWTSIGRTMQPFQGIKKCWTSTRRSLEPLQEIRARWNLTRRSLPPLITTRICWTSIRNFVRPLREIWLYYPPGTTSSKTPRMRDLMSPQIRSNLKFCLMDAIEVFPTKLNLEYFLRFWSKSHLKRSTPRLRDWKSH